MKDTKTAESKRVAHLNLIMYRLVILEQKNLHYPILRFKLNQGKLRRLSEGLAAGKSTLMNLIPRFYDVDKWDDSCKWSRYS